MANRAYLQHNASQAYSIEGGEEVINREDAKLGKNKTLDSYGVELYRYDDLKRIANERLAD
jgi:hypothetical protein